MATSDTPKDTLGDKPRFRIDAPATPPSKRQHELLKATIIRRLQKAQAEMAAAYQQARGLPELTKFLVDTQAELGRQVVKLSGPVISLHELVG